VPTRPQLYPKYTTYFLKEIISILHPKKLTKWEKGERRGWHTVAIIAPLKSTVPVR